MDENSRVPQRTRPRPYDLRRKVLLKNFLREQMTQIPLPPPRSSEVSLNVNSDSNADEDSLIAIGNEENIEKPNNLQENMSSSLPEPIPSTSTYNDTENLVDSSTNEQPKDEVNEIPQPKFSILSRLRSRRKGISKAKLKIKVKTPAKSILHISKKTDSGSSAKNKARSFFTMFKTRREKKRKNLDSPSTTTTHQSSMSNQSVQTDVSFTQEEYNNMEQSNKCLREENRLLSESLSTFMSDFDLKLSPLKIPYGTDSYITSSGSSDLPYTPQRNSVDVTKHENRNGRNDLSRVKVLRSNSMPERQSKQPSDLKSRLSFKRKNATLSKRFYDSSYLKEREKKYGVDPASIEQLASYQNHIMSYWKCNKYKTRSFSAFVSPDGQGSSRESPHGASVLKNLPINHSDRAIVRRSSMPERTGPNRPILRDRPRQRGYNRAYRDMHNTDHNYNLNEDSPPRRKSNGMVW